MRQVFMAKIKGPASHRAFEITGLNFLDKWKCRGVADSRRQNAAGVGINTTRAHKGGQYIV